MKKYYFIFWTSIMMLSVSSCFSQFSGHIRMTLDEAIKKAQNHSYESVLAENKYMSAYWSFRAFKAQSLPSLSLVMNPFAYNRDITRQFNIVDTTYNYFEQKNINSEARFLVDQNITATGGSIFLDSDLRRLENFGGSTNSRQYSATAIRLGLRQSLFSFNHFKWDKKLEPIKYEKEEKIYIQAREEIAINTIKLFFEYIKAQLQHEIATSNLKHSDSLYQIGQRAYDIGKVSRTNLLALRLKSVNDKNYKIEVENILRRARVLFHSSLGLDSELNVNLILPETLNDFIIDPSFALTMVKRNNPQYIDLEIATLESYESLDQARADAHFKADISASFGLNQSGEDIDLVYSDMLGQQRVNVTIDIPLVDWGIKKGQYSLARKNQLAMEVYAEQQRELLENDIILSVSEFNLHQEKVRGAKEVLDLANELYEIGLRSYYLELNKVNVEELIVLENRRDQSILSYYTILESYWDSYYNLRRLTLYDFINNIDIISNKAIN